MKRENDKKKLKREGKQQLNNIKTTMKIYRQLIMHEYYCTLNGKIGNSREI